MAETQRWFEMLSAGIRCADEVVAAQEAREMGQ
jgi:hypothetical protein